MADAYIRKAELTTIPNQGWKIDYIIEIVRAPYGPLRLVVERTAGRGFIVGHPKLGVSKGTLGPYDFPPYAIKVLSGSATIAEKIFGEWTPKLTVHRVTVAGKEVKPGDTVTISSWGALISVWIEGTISHNHPFPLDVYCKATSGGYLAAYGMATIPPARKGTVRAHMEVLVRDGKLRVEGRIPPPHISLSRLHSLQPFAPYLSVGISFGILVPAVFRGIRIKRFKPLARFGTVKITYEKPKPKPVLPAPVGIKAYITKVRVYQYVPEPGKPPKLVEAVREIPIPPPPTVEPITFKARSDLILFIDVHVKNIGASTGPRLMVSIRRLPELRQVAAKPVPPMITGMERKITFSGRALSFISKPTGEVELQVALIDVKENRILHAFNLEASQEWLYPLIY